VWQNSFWGKVAKKKNGRPADRGCLDEVGLRLNWARLRVRVGFGLGLVWLVGPGSLGQFGWVEPGRAWCWAARVGLGVGFG